VVPSGGAPFAQTGPLPRFHTSEGTLELLTVQPPGKKPMPGDAYLRGLKR
jgi:methionyl-tRNA formyltransferase